MTTAAAPTRTRFSAEQISVRGHVGLVVLASIATGIALGLVLVLGVFAGGAEARIVGSALIALGAGFVLLAAASTRRTDQPQRWALPPGAASIATGLAVLVLAPGEHELALAGWIWPVLLGGVVGWSFRGARRSLHNWSRTAVLYPALAVLGLVAAGGAFETVAEATSSNPAPPAGHLYSVNGHSLYLSCAGTGAPAVVLLNGLGERTPSWAWVQRTVARTTRVCTFDRAGEGWSAGTTTGQDGHQLSFDLHALLRAARVPAPYVLAGHSVGGAYALAYAAQYPEQVSGIALVDASTPYQFDLPDYPGFYSMWRRGQALLPSVARTGLARLAAHESFATLPPDARRAARFFTASPRELRADRLELAELPTVFRQAKELTSLDGKPLAVVTANEGMQRGWLRAQKKLARLSRNSSQQSVIGATHTALLEDEGFAWITSRAISEVVQSARSGR